MLTGPARAPAPAPAPAPVAAAAAAAAAATAASSRPLRRVAPGRRIVDQVAPGNPSSCKIPFFYGLLRTFADRN
jgi:hypothetical protein